MSLTDINEKAGHWTGLQILKLQMKGVNTALPWCDSLIIAAHPGSVYATLRPGGGMGHVGRTMLWWRAPARVCSGFKKRMGISGTVISDSCQVRKVWEKHKNSFRHLNPQ